MNLRAAPLYILGAALLPIIIMAGLVSVALYKIDQAYRTER